MNSDYVIARSTPLTDEQLMALVVGGDRDAFEALVVRYRGRVFRIARVMSGEDSTAEDILQESFIAALRGAHTFRGESFRAWLYTITRHEAARMCRRVIPIPTEDTTLEALGLAAGWGDDREDGSPPATSELVFAALATLPDEDRAILLLRDVEGLTGQEAADVLDLGLAAMKSRLHRARLRLAAAVRFHGGRDARP